MHESELTAEQERLLKTAVEAREDGINYYHRDTVAQMADMTADGIKHHAYRAKTGKLTGKLFNKGRLRLYSEDEVRTFLQVHASKKSIEELTD